MFIRCRELQNLKNDYDKFKQQKQSELSGQINQKLLLENELQQIKISLKNSENLLGRYVVTNKLIESNLVWVFQWIKPSLLMNLPKLWKRKSRKLKNLKTMCTV